MAQGQSKTNETLRAPELAIARTLPPNGCGLEEARGYVRWLGRHQYENFHVVSRLLPRRYHDDFYSVYAYCRWADDLGDEIGDSARAVALLDEWERELERCYNGCATHPVFIALAPTVRTRDIPIEPFRDLLTAFRQDQSVLRYHSWESVLAYCRYSANPVGRLVLYLTGYRDAERQSLSDSTCAALQLANFWQDVARDLKKGRIYIPLDLAPQHGVAETDILGKQFTPAYAALMKDLIQRTRILFAAGAPLERMVAPFLRVDLELFRRGGCGILDAIERIGYDTLHRRPELNRWSKALLLSRVVAAKLRRAATGDRAPFPAADSAGNEKGSYAQRRA
jgi:squalene synthase HpnC